jgi:remodeling and spacing factor 1
LLACNKKDNKFIISFVFRYCPECQHKTLVERLQENLESFELLLKKRNADTKRKERLAFVSLSLSNIIPKTGARAPKAEGDGPEPKREKRERKKRPPQSGSSGTSDSSGSSSGNFTF